jgi:AbiV family abortive infection protein
MRELLLTGAAFALENCGDLLREAVAMNHRGSYGFAVATAMFAREELGKFRMLRERFETVAAGGTVDLNDLASRNGPLFGHIDKQEEAVLSVVTHLKRDSPEWKAWSALNDCDPGTPEWQKAQNEWETFTKAREKALPKERHNRRMAAMYVGLNARRTGWTRPQDVTQQEAEQEVCHAVGDYNNTVRLLNNNPSPDLAFSAAFHAWEDRPSLSPINAFAK